MVAKGFDRALTMMTPNLLGGVREQMLKDVRSMAVEARK